VTDAPSAPDARFNLPQLEQNTRTLSRLASSLSAQSLSRDPEAPVTRKELLTLLRKAGPNYLAARQILGERHRVVQQFDLVLDQIERAGIRL
jgi:HAMP domain-containing protein